MHKQVPLHVALIRYLIYFATVVVSRWVSALPPESRDPFPSPQSILHIGSQCNRFTRARESFVQTSYIVVTLIAFSLRFRGDKSTWSRSPFAYNGYRETNDFSGDKNLRCSVCLLREVRLARLVGQPYSSDLLRKEIPSSFYKYKSWNNNESQEWNIWTDGRMGSLSRSSRWSLKRPSVKLETKKWESEYK